MTAYELMIKTNYNLIKDGELTEIQKTDIVRQLLAAKSDERTKQSFHKSMDGAMYPLYFIPPYNNNKKFQTIIPMSPKTHILSANAYELEILRLLVLFAPDNPDVKDMVKNTLARLKSTCFGNGCAAGECFESVVIVLRFLAAVAPDDTTWIKKLIDFYYKHIGDKRRHGNVLWYYWLCLSELPFEIAEPEIQKYKDKIFHQLNRSSVMNSGNDKINHPVMICAIRNALARLPEYTYIKERQPYINEKDGRLYFDMNFSLI